MARGLTTAGWVVVAVLGLAGLGGACRTAPTVVPDAPMANDREPTASPEPAPVPTPPPEPERPSAPTPTEAPTPEPSAEPDPIVPATTGSQDATESFDSNDTVPQEDPEVDDPPDYAPIDDFECCKVCHKGKACGDTCIARNRSCTVPPGCACDG